MPKLLTRVLLAAVLAFGAFAPASADVAPVITITSGHYFGPTGSPHVVTGSIALGPSDTYVAGGFTVPAAAFGFGNAVSFVVVSQVNGQYTIAPSYVAGSVNFKINAAIAGAANIPATAVTVNVTVPASNAVQAFSATSPVLCAFNDSASGGGTGTWGATVAVNTCSYLSPTSFKIKSTGAAPTGGGNFSYLLPNNFAEVTSGSNVSSIVIPFTAYGI